MKLWHRIIIIIVALFIASLAAGRLWFMAFDFVKPSYLAGGLVAIPVWELTRWIGTKYP